jgi:hypothetical protein
VKRTAARLSSPVVWWAVGRQPCEVDLDDETNTQKKKVNGKTNYPQQVALNYTAIQLHYASIVTSPSPPTTPQKKFMPSSPPKPRRIATRLLCGTGPEILAPYAGRAGALRTTDVDVSGGGQTCCGWNAGRQERRWRSRTRRQVLNMRGRTAKQVQDCAARLLADQRRAETASRAAASGETALHTISTGWLTPTVGGLSSGQFWQVAAACWIQDADLIRWTENPSMHRGQPHRSQLPALVQQWHQTETTRCWPCRADDAQVRQHFPVRTTARPRRLRCYDPPPPQW